MPVTILTPAPDTLVGPGLEVHVTTDLIGPWPSGTSWQIQIFTTPQEWQVGEGVRFSVSNQETIYTGLHLDAQGVQTQLLYPEQGFQTLPAPSTLIARFRDPNFQVLDQTSIPVMWQPTANGVAWVEQQVQGQTEGGLTPVQAQQLEYTMAYAAMGIGMQAPTLPAALAALIPLGYNLLLIEPDRTGAGELTRPLGPLNTDALGIAWQIRYAPVGIGLNPGAPPSYDITMMELGKTRRMLQGEIVIDASLETAESDRCWIWNLDYPHSVRYLIAPGVIARFWWVLFGGGGVEDLVADQLRRELPAAAQSH